VREQGQGARSKKRRFNIGFSLRAGAGLIRCEKKINGWFEGGAKVLESLLWKLIGNRSIDLPEKSPFQQVHKASGFGGVNLAKTPYFVRIDSARPLELNLNLARANSASPEHPWG
jgi:hypothetical protein